MGGRQTKPKKPIEPSELIRHMTNNPDVVLQYYQTHEEQVVKYIVENFWEEDVEHWLTKIRERSPIEELKVRRVDYLKEKNQTEHNTDRYENPTLVLRRAGTFDVNVEFGSRRFKPDLDDIYINFSLGTEPSEATGTKFVCSVNSEPGEKTDWYCYALPSDETNPKKLSLRVNIPAKAIVGRYQVSFDIVSGTKEGRLKSTHNANTIIVLFNPFSLDDNVYLEDEAQRNEYVLNDNGFICIGSYWSIGKKIWDYAQFDEGVLDDVLKMLVNDSRHQRQPLKTWKKLSNPVYVTRVLSAMVNCNNDDGVIYGRWDGEYEGGKSPTTWSNSAKILQEWADNGMKPVKYGQCWVFAAVLTTALRALGIGGRCITNFASAHDTDANVTVDMYYDADSGEKLDETSDSVWNFHVWNEGFFKRPDLPEGYDGWQVLDATPQETSEIIDPQGNSTMRLFQCGPAPVKAIKEGNINIGYDTNFIFGEVNADKANWTVRDGKVTGPPQVIKSAIGKNISTKAVGSYEREDVTAEYKYAEGTEEERVAFRRAYGRGTRSKWIEGGGKDLIKQKFKVKIAKKEKSGALGKDIITTVTVENIIKEKVNADIKVVGNSKRHVGLVHALLKKVKETIDLEPGEVHEIPFSIQQSEYMRNVVDNKVVSITVIASDTKDGNTTMEELEFSLGMPEGAFTTTAPATIAKLEDTIFDIVFENKLQLTLTKGVFEVNVRGNVYGDREFAVGGPIKPGEKFTLKDIKVRPRSNWSYVVVNVTFTSADLGDVTYRLPMEAST